MAKRDERISHSAKLFARARRYIPGGVSSPVRAFRSVGGTPLFIKRGYGCRLRDEDGNEYIDYVCSWGPLILGHAHPMVVAALKKAVETGTSFGAPTELEATLAKLVTHAMPAVQMVRFVNSGTEATMSALRLARAYTGRTKIVKFAGCYHGHADGLLAKAGSGAATLGLPDSPGVPSSYTRETLIARYNHLDSVERLFDRYRGKIAAVIVEPVAGNMGVIPPEPGFLAGLRSLTRRHGTLLIFDEVITGFRVGYGGAQGLYGVVPDLTCLGKIIGGGLPVGAYGGRREIMEMVAPSGPVYQAGTLSGNPLAMTAGIQTLKALRAPGVYETLEQRSAILEKELLAAAASAGLPVRVNRVGSMLTLFFTEKQVTDYESARSSDTKQYGQYFHHMLEMGIYLPPSQFEAIFVSLAHGEEEIRATIAAAARAFNRLR